MKECPTFENAIQSFEGFLKSENKSQAIQWLFREDITTYKLKMWIKIPYFENHWEVAKKIYQLGLDRGFGIRIIQIGSINNDSLCYIWLPQDELDMDQSMMDHNLKLSISQTNRGITPIKNSGFWNLIKWVNSKRGYNYLESDMPSRKSLMV
ncbi:MAG: hypothetical protein OEV42_00445 [Deltaproteobacteria bacterium]|nr:hypothetical protein [Deltaproteobacteria bacterium]